MYCNLCIHRLGGVDPAELPLHGTYSIPDVELDVPAAAWQWSGLAAPLRSCQGRVDEVVTKCMTFIAVPPVLRAQSAPALSAHHTMASNELTVVEAQHAAGAALHFLLGKELVLAAIGCVPVTSTLQWCEFTNIAEIPTL